MNNLNEFLEILLYAVITVILPICMTYGRKLVNDIVEENKLAKENDLIADAVSIIEDVVISTNQTFVDAVKRENGKLTKEDAVVAFNRARNTAIKLLSEEVRDVIKNKYGDFDIWLQTEIETYVNQNKTEYED